MGGLGASFLFRRARSSWLLLTCVAVTILLTTGLAAVLWTFSAAVVPLGAQGILAGSQGRVMSLSGVVDADEATTDSQQIAATLRKAWPGVGFQLESAVWSTPLQLSASASSPAISQIQPASLDGIRAEATLTAGAWPGAPRAGGPVPMALPDTAASQLHVGLGSVLTAAPQDGGATVSLQVTGLYRAKDPASPYWALDLLPVSGVSVSQYQVVYAGLSQPGSTVTYGPAVVNPAAFDSALTVGEGSWMVLPQAAPMARGNIDALNTSTSSAVSQLTVLLPDGLKVTSSLPRLLAGIASTIVLTRSLFTIAALQLLLLAGAGLVLAARLLASMREEESALLRARGATRWQVLRPVLAEAVLIGVVAGLAGVLAGTSLTSPLARLAGLRIRDYTSGISSLAWLSALAVLVVCVAVMAWPALHTLSPGMARIRRDRQARLATIAWAGGDVALVALAVIAVWELRGYSAVAHPASGSLGIDPVVALAPALALAGVALIPLRGLPLLARLADRMTDNERRLAAAMVSWQIARRPIRQAGPVLLVVIAATTTTLAVAGYASWRQSAADQASFVVGSDVRVDTAGPLPLGATGQVAKAKGVTAATAASITGLGNASAAGTGDYSLSGTGVTDTSGNGQMIALDGGTADKTILLRSDLSPLPLSTLWQRITPKQQPGLVLPGKPERLEVRAALGAAPGTSAAAVLNALGAVSVQALVQDATGGTYGIPSSGLLAADGKPQSLIFPLSNSQQASYPLRLLGFTMTYVLPPYDVKDPPYSPTARLTVASLTVADTVSGPFGQPFADGADLASWQGSGTSARVPTGPPNAAGGMPPADGVPPSVVRWASAAGGARVLTFSTGHAPSHAIELSYALSPGTATGQVSLLIKTPTRVIPAIATSRYLAANKLSVGSTTTVSANGFQFPVLIVASVTDFPSVTGQGGALIADLSDVNDLFAASYAMPLPVTRWWLSTADDRVPSLPAGLGLSVTSRASQQAALIDNPLLTAPRQAMLAVGVAAVLLGVLGFSVSVAASLRSRRTQSAVFAAMGVGKNAQAGQLCLEQCALSLPAAAAGLLAGIGLAELMVPAITLTSDAAAPVPSALLILPLGPAIGLALITAAVPVAAAALSVLRRPDPAAQLRAEAI